MLWSNTTRPKYLGTANGEIHNCFADARGWVRRHDKGNGRYWEEVLVPGAGFPAAGGDPTVAAVVFTGISHYTLINSNANVSSIPVGTVFRQANATTNTGFGTVLSINAAANSFILSRTSGRFNTANVLQAVNSSVANVTADAANNYASGNISAYYDERVVTTGTPLINVTSSATANVQGSFVTGNNTNRLVFNFTVTAGTASVISIAANSIALNSGTIKDASNTSVNANNEFVAGTVANAAFGQSGKTLAI